MRITLVSPICVLITIYTIKQIKKNVLVKKIDTCYKFFFFKLVRITNRVFFLLLFLAINYNVYKPRGKNCDIPSHFVPIIFFQNGYLLLIHVESKEFWEGKVL